MTSFTKRSGTSFTLGPQVPRAGVEAWGAAARGRVRRQAAMEKQSDTLIVIGYANCALETNNDRTEPIFGEMNYAG
jgi:hypothetical protein